MSKYFGTDGFRGEANVDLTAEHAFKIGRFIGWYYGREHKARIVIGKDTPAARAICTSAHSLQDSPAPARTHICCTSPRRQA